MPLVLTDQQRQILDGKKGTFLQRYMEWMYKWGTAMGARRMIPVENVLTGGLSAPGHMMAGASRNAVEKQREWMKALCRHRVKCTTFAHIAALDLESPTYIGTEPEDISFQQELIELGRQAGIHMTWTCTPYLVGNVPTKGQICAWTESHAVVYINSFLGARSTRHGGDSAIAAAVLGFVPEFGVLLDENRRAELLINVSTELETDTDWGLLGYYVGKIAGLRSPAFKNVAPPRLESAKQLCAGLATSGGVTMCHIIGVTPEAPNEETVFPMGQPREVYTVGRSELEETRDCLQNAKSDDIDFVYMGCPHATLQEIGEAARLLEGRRISENVSLVITMPYAIKAYAERLGYAEIIRRAGGHLMTDTCPCSAVFPKKRRMITNSVKHAHYSRAILGNEVILANSDDCIASAIAGRWVR